MTSEVREYAATLAVTRVRALTVLFLLIVFLGQLGCATTRHKQAEISATVLAGAAREAELAGALIEEAHAARDAGDYARCLELARLALRSRAKAEPLALRLLYSLGIELPSGDAGDPGPAPEPPSPTTECGEPAPQPRITR